LLLTRSPLRISLGGGGTDLPSYYRKSGGFLIAGAIQQYIYVSLHKTFVDEFILKYSEIERCEDVDQIKHPIVREALKMLDVSPNSLEISSLADIPAGTGLGSSGTFTCALLKSLYEFKGIQVSQRSLAEAACEIEIDRLREPSGKQDQYISSFGGVTAFTFNEDDSVDIKKVEISDSQKFDLEDSLIMFFTGYSRRSTKILAEQNEATKQDDSSMMANLDNVKRIGYESLNALESHNFSFFGELMHEHWLNKQKRSKSMLNESINDAYNLARRNGAIGGKLVGAGGGGFLLFVTKDKKATRNAFRTLGLREVPVSFDYSGTQTVIGR